MIPRYNTDLTGESNLNVSKRRIINKLVQTYSEYPEVYLTESAYRDNKKLETMLNSIYTNMDLILLLFKESIDGINTNGDASEFNDEGEYEDHIIALRQLITQEIPKLRRALEVIYSNIDSLKLKDFNKINEYINEISNLYAVLKSLVIKDLNADNLYDFFKFLEDNISGYLKGGAGKKGRSGRKKKPEPESKSENIMKYLTKGKKKEMEEEDEEDEGEDEVIDLAELEAEFEKLQKGEAGVAFNPQLENVYEYEPDESLGSDIYDYTIDRAKIKDVWIKLMILLEGANGVFTRWNALKRIYNEKRPSLKPNPKQSMREDKEDKEEMEGGYIYDASLPTPVCKWH